MSNDLLNDQCWLVIEDCNINYSDYYQQKNDQKDQFVKKLANLVEGVQKRKADSSNAPYDNH